MHTRYTYNVGVIVSSVRLCENDDVQHRPLRGNYSNTQNKNLCSVPSGRNKTKKQSFTNKEN